MIAADIARALGGAHRYGQWWRCRCPIHASSGPTLALDDGDRGLVVHCHAGRCRADILAELGRRGLTADHGEARPISDPEAGTRRRDAGAADRQRGIAEGLDIWGASYPADASPQVPRYLASRGYPIPPSLGLDSVRNPSLDLGTVNRVETIRREVPARSAGAGRSLTYSKCSPSADRERAAVRSTQRRAQLRARPTDFAAVNRVALAILPMLLERWLPGGRTEGAEFVAINPRRPDRHLGSFRISTRTGRWADFAIAGARGGDPVSLAAYLAGIGQLEAAERLAEMLGIEANDGR
jgi:hypothetical protein